MCDKESRRLAFKPLGNLRKLYSVCRDFTSWNLCVDIHWSWNSPFFIVKSMTARRLSTPSCSCQTATSRQHGSTVAPPSKDCTVKRPPPPNSQVPDSEVNPLHSENAVYRVSTVAWKGVLPSGKALSWLLGLLVGCAGLKVATLKIKIPWKCRWRILN